jgi:lipoprotein signal peptidase
MKSISKSAQGILEYSILLGAIVAVIVVVMVRKDNGIGARVNASYVKMGGALSNVTDSFTNQLVN